MTKGAREKREEFVENEKRAERIFLSALLV